MPYFDLPATLGRWFTTASAIRSGDVEAANQAGMKRCISPYNLTDSRTDAR